VVATLTLTPNSYGRCALTERLAAAFAVLRLDRCLAGLTRFALLADAACCRCSARRSSDHPLKAPIIMRLVDFRRPDTLAMACSTQKSNGFY
jgi:hypothetical protein